MKQPVRRMLLVLSRELHKPLFEIMSWPKSEILDQIAFNLTQNEAWRKEYEREQFLKLPAKERAALVKAMMN
ncbi:hypothetical protein ACQP6C_12025 [Snodgrassella alvi]|uniref:hypothetical protein n=1 Tax=Snodgrassella alvi TaxID=1196083 RepID=UPI003D03DC7B